MILCLDFDDTLCDAADAPLPGAREALDALRATGWDLVVNSARFDPLYGELLPRRVEAVARWLRHHDFPPAQVVEQVPAADCYVDDRGLQLSGDWRADTESILASVGAAWGGRRGRVSVLFDEVWNLDTGEPAPGAAGALCRLAEAGCEIALAAPGLPAKLGATVLGSNGFPRLRVSPHKLASRVYASRRARHFGGDWSAFRLED